MLVLKLDVVAGIEVARQGGQAERGEERVLDRASVLPVDGRLGRADELDAERPAGRSVGPTCAAHPTSPGWDAKWATSTSRPVSNSPGLSHTARRMPTVIMLGYSAQWPASWATMSEVWTSSPSMRA